MSTSEKAIICAQLALVRATEGSFDSDEGIQQLRVITNLLATARRVVVRQQRTIDVLRSPSKRRRDAATSVTEEDVTAMAFVASMEVCLLIVASND